VFTRVKKTRLLLDRHQPPFPHVDTTMGVSLLIPSIEIAHISGGQAPPQHFSRTSLSSARLWPQWPLCNYHPRLLRDVQNIHLYDPPRYPSFGNRLILATTDAHISPLVACFSFNQGEGGVASPDQDSPPLSSLHFTFYEVQVLRALCRFSKQISTR